MLSCQKECQIPSAKLVLAFKHNVGGKAMGVMCFFWLYLEMCWSEVSIIQF